MPDSSLRSRMTGRYLILFCKKTLFTFLLQLAPFVNLTVDTAPVGRVWRFTHFCSVAPLLEKWFACFPTCGDGFRNGGFCFCDGQDVFFV